ncbi:SGNH/GDSL hydrolase family protein [Rufibacter roseus]|uniref:SGNH/GDSL hydrolase family protein n=1 Tax=Rufibacter roseus TaxID=1567108 RepID=A0ABW2DS68_9BACT|nr:SGNH/GDSL hydrolase family protein [Rufibacter roseus]
MINKWVRGFQFVAVQFLVLVLLLLLLNGLLSVFYQYKDRQLKQTNPIAQKYGYEALQKVYPGYSKEELDELLTETWTRKQQYESFTGFKEAPFKGKYLNVHVAGFRIGLNQGPWPLDTQLVNVFMFGGSTTFGYGVADSETLPSKLQKSLQQVNKKVRVYNFGRGFYYSEQERALFQKLLLEGAKPDVVVFVDGLNEYFQPEPEFTEETKLLFEQKPSTLFSYWLQNLSLSRMVQSFRYRLLGVSPESEEEVNISCEATDVNTIHERYWLNQQMIAAVANQLNIPVYFVWQPISCYGYSPKEPIFMTEAERQNCYPDCGYEQMRQIWQKKGEGKNLIWLADIQQNREEYLYVDKVHYTAAFHAVLADSLAVELLKREPKLTENSSL